MTLPSGKYRIGLFAFIKPAVHDLCVGMFPLPCTGEVCLRVESEKWLGADFHSGLFDEFGYFAGMGREQGIHAGLSNAGQHLTKSPALEAFHQWESAMGNETIHVTFGNKSHFLIIASNKGGTVRSSLCMVPNGFARIGIS